MAPYALVGRVGAVSVMGLSSGWPYDAALEEKTIRGTSAATIARSTASEPPTLPSQYFPGSLPDSPTRDLAAKCSRPS